MTLLIHDGRHGRTALHAGGNVGDGDADVTARGVVGVRIIHHGTWICPGDCAFTFVRIIAVCTSVQNSIHVLGPRCRHVHIGYQVLLYVSISLMVGPHPTGNKKRCRDRRGKYTATTSDDDFQVDVDLVVKLQAFG